MNLPLDPSSLPYAPDQVGVIIVDHGSRRAESNDLLPEVVRLYRDDSKLSIVEAAHMELAKPSLADAFDRCVDAGAQLVIVHPYFLLPGRHWDQDIPRLAAEAAAAHPHVRYLVTAPLGIHQLMAQIIQDRIHHCLLHAQEAVEACELCAGTDKCRIRAAIPE